MHPEEFEALLIRARSGDADDASQTLAEIPPNSSKKLLTENVALLYREPVAELDHCLLLDNIPAVYAILGMPAFKTGGDIIHITTYRYY